MATKEAAITSAQAKANELDKNVFVFFKANANDYVLVTQETLNKNNIALDDSRVVHKSSPKKEEKVTESESTAVAPEPVSVPEKKTRKSSASKTEEKPIETVPDKKNDDVVTTLTPENHEFLVKILGLQHVNDAVTILHNLYESYEARQEGTGKAILHKFRVGPKDAKKGDENGS